MSEQKKRLGAILLAGGLALSGCGAVMLPARPPLEIIPTEDGGICLPASSAAALAMWVLEIYEALKIEPPALR